MIAVAVLGFGCTRAENPAADPDEPVETTAVPEDAPDEGVPDDELADEDEAPPEEDTDDVGLLAATLAVLGFTVLVGVAGWWMLRNWNPDDEVGRPDRHDWPDEDMSI